MINLLRFLKKQGFPLTERWHRWCALLLLTALFILLVNGILQTSLTYDEPSHLAAGFAFLARGQAGLWTVPLRGHPLLINAYAALPLYLGNPTLAVEELEGWGVDRRTFAYSFIHAVGPLSVSEFSGRYLCALLTIMLASVIYRWAAEQWNSPTGLLALGVLCFDPTLLAHGRLATNDVGVTAFGTLGLYLAWRWLRKRDWQNAGLLGIVMGLTLLAKSSGVLWAAAVGLIALWTLIRAFDYRLALQLLMVGGLALFIIWAMYGFSIGPLTTWPNLLVPAPLHWNSVLFQTQQAANRPFYALGQLSSGHRWWYFPFAFMIKNPLPLLLALGLAVSHLKWKTWRTLSLLSLFSALYLTIAIVKGPNIGYRHLFPVHPLFYLLIAQAGNRIWHAPPRKVKLPAYTYKVGMLLWGIWYIVTALWTTPHEIAFFNALVGGSDNGWYYLSDSNTDWMQGLKALRAWQQKTGVHFRYTGPDGYVGLSSYRLDYDPLPSTRENPEPVFQTAYHPEPGDYIVSAHSLNGLSVTEPDNYAWFRYHKPDAVIAHVLFYYHVEPLDQETWVIQCTHPAPPLDTAAVENGFATSGQPLRHVEVDCRETWVYPSATESPGWYALHKQALQDKTWIQRLAMHTSPQAQDPFIARHVQDFPLSYYQQTYRLLPAFALYESLAQPTPAPPVTQHYTAPAGTPPQNLTDAVHHAVPTPLQGGPLTFLGAAVYALKDSTGTQSLDVETWWRVTGEEQPSRPLSVMAHLLDDAGQTLAVADGLGMPPTTWQAGDIFVQRHTFPNSDLHGENLWLRTGIYWLDDGTRWAIGDADAMFVPLSDNIP